MTQNQLKYWELRWKQHYEKILAEVKVREIAETERHNRAVEQETYRHNRREERIDTQNMIINRMNLDARWAELNEKKRAAMVAEALNEKKYYLAVQQELRETRYTNAQINKMLSDVKLASMDLAMSVVNNKHRIAAEYMKAEAALFKNGWTKAAAGEVIADIKGLMSSTEFDKLLVELKKDDTFSWMTETFGPEASNKILEAGGNSSQTAGEKDKPKSDIFKRYESRPDFQPIQKQDTPVSGFTNTQTTGGNTNGTSIQKGSSGADYYNDHRQAGSTMNPIETKTSSGTSVIYSGGSHYGPGY